MSNNIEEDIKIVEKMLEKGREVSEEQFCELIGIKHIQAISNILNEYKKNKKIVNRAKRYCRNESTFQTYGDDRLERILEMYVNRTKNEVLKLLEDK